MAHIDPRTGQVVPDPGDPPMAPGMTQVPDFTTTTTHAPSVSRTEKGEERSGLDLEGTDYAERKDEYDNAAAEQAAADAEQRKNLKAQEVADELKASELEMAQRHRREQLADAVASHRSEQGAINEELRAAQAARGRSFMDDLSTPWKILAAVMVGLGEGANRQGGPSSVRQILDQRFEQDRAAKQARYEDAVNRGKMSQDQFDRAMKLIDNAHQVELENIAARADKWKAKFPTKVNEFDALAAQAKQKAADIAIRREMDAADKVSAPTQSRTVSQEGTSVATTEGKVAAGAKPSDGQQKLALLAKGMEGELSTIAENPELTSATLDKIQANQTTAEAADKTAGQGVLDSLSVRAGRAADLIPKSKYSDLTPQEQKVANAWDNLTEKYTRMLTGAGMPADEARRMTLQNAPVAGDSAEVVKQKLARMKDATSQMMSLSGSAASAVSPAKPAPASAPRKSAGDLTPAQLRELNTIARDKNAPLEKRQQADRWLKAYAASKKAGRK